eukprot:1631985-Amphidinium_carterae.1
MLPPTEQNSSIMAITPETACGTAVGQCVVGQLKVLRHFYQEQGGTIHYIATNQVLLSRSKILDEQKEVPVQNNGGSLEASRLQPCQRTRNLPAAGPMAAKIPNSLVWRPSHRMALVLGTKL